MRIRFASTVAVLAAAGLVLSACSSSDDATGSSTDQAAGSTSAAAAAGTAGSAAPADKSGAAGSAAGGECTIDQPVKVGTVFSLTGAAASYGATQKNGLQLAVDQLNAKGGVKYDVKIEDDATDPKQGISIFEQMIGDGVSVLIGPTLSNGAKQADPVAQEAKVPVLGVSNTATGITDIGDHVFRDSLTEEAVIPQTITEAKAKLGLKKVVVLYSNDDAFTESGYQAMAAALKKEGVQDIKTLTFSKADTDFRSLLTEAKAAQPDALVVSALIEAAVPLVTQARQLGIDVPIIGGNGFNSPKLMSDAGKAAENVIVGAAWNSASDNPENTAFMKAYKDKYNADPDQFAAQAFTGMIVIDHAVRAGCSGDRESIKEQLGKISDLKTPLGDFSINDSRDADHTAVVQIVKDGKFVVLS